MEFLRSPALETHNHIMHGFFGSEGGVSSGVFASLNCGSKSGDAPENIWENRTLVAAEFGSSPKDILTLHQVHGDEVLAVTEPWRMGKSPQADAMITGVPGLLLGILTADCVPVLLADPVAGLVGAAHAGWRGAIAGIVTATLQSLEYAGSKPENIIVAIGPCIRQQSYEVGAEVHAEAAAKNSSYGTCFKPSEKAGHYLLDVPAIIKQQLRNAGVTQVHDCEEDTYTQPTQYFSYRRNTHQGHTQYGRQISVIGLV